MLDVSLKAGFANRPHQHFVLVPLVAGQNKFQVGFTGNDKTECLNEAQVILVRPELRGIKHEAVGEAKPGAHFLEVRHAVFRESLAQGRRGNDGDLFRRNVQQPDNVRLYIFGLADDLACTLRQAKIDAPAEIPLQP